MQHRRVVDGTRWIKRPTRRRCAVGLTACLLAAFTLSAEGCNDDALMITPAIDAISPDILVQLDAAMVPLPADLEMDHCTPINNPPTPSSIECYDVQVCKFPKVCCVVEQCAANCRQNDGYYCDGPEDCPGQQCCYNWIIDGTIWSRCGDTCPQSRMCHAAADCLAGEICDGRWNPQFFFPRSSGVCTTTPSCF